MFASDVFFALSVFLPIIIYVVLTGFGIYFVIKVIKFMNEKTKLDRERNAKLDELIRAVSPDKKME